MLLIAWQNQTDDHQSVVCPIVAGWHIEEDWKTQNQDMETCHYRRMVTILENKIFDCIVPYD